MVHPYSSTDTTAVSRKPFFILSEWSDFHMIDSLLIALHAFARRILISFLDDTIYQPLRSGRIWHKVNF